MHEEPLPSRAQSAAVTAVVFACAISAGAHAALLGEHLGASPALGVGFILATVLLGATATMLVLRPHDRRASSAAGLVLAGLIAAWALSRTTGLPILHPAVEPADAVGVATKVVEAVGLAGALWLSQPAAGRKPAALQEVSR